VNEKGILACSSSRRGGEARELLRIDGEKEAPFWGSQCWTPDGGYIYFMRGVKGEASRPKQWHWWRVSAEGGEPQQLGLTVGGRQMGALRLHPDGRRLATSEFEVDLEIWVMENFLPKSPAVPGAKPN
jgi:Tol biopolymer transport system component